MSASQDILVRHRAGHKLPPASIAEVLGNVTSLTAGPISSFDYALRNSPEFQIIAEEMFSYNSTVRIALDPSDVMLVGALRYEKFVRRDGKKYRQADHATGSFIEPIDDLSINFFQVENGACQAAVRVTRALDGYSDPHMTKLLESSGLSHQFIEHSVINSRMVIDAGLGAKIRIIGLFRSIYYCGLLLGAKHCIVSTRNELIPLFERFGFVSSGVAYVDPVAGNLNIMVLDALDYSHLSSVKSPYLAPYLHFLQRA